MQQFGHRRSTRRSSTRTTVAALLSVGLVVGACSAKDDGTAVDGGVTTEAPGGTDAPPSSDTAPDTAPPDTAVAGDASPEYGGVLRVSGEAEATNPWTPAAIQCDQYCYLRAGAFYDNLIAVNADGEFSGELVESFEHNEDYTVWTFRLRPGITFHDDTPLDAEAVVYNLQQHASSLLTAAAIADFGRNPDGTFAIEATDELTFTITTGKGGDLSKPVKWATLPAFLAGQLGFIASPTWLEAVKAGTADQSIPVGTGAFIVESYAPRELLVATRNPNYWRTDAAGNQLPYLDGVEFRVIEDSETAGEALQSRDIDIFATSASVVIADFREIADEFPMLEQNKFTETNYTMIDLDKPGPLQDRRVRCALSKAINREELIELTGGGILEVANGLFSPGQEGHLDDNGFDTSQDIEGARALIAEYQAENPGPISVMYGTTVTNINSQTAELLRGYWEELGVETTIVQVPQDQYITKALFGDPEYFMYGWRQHGGNYVDAQYLWWHSSTAQPDGGLSLNFARLRDQVIDENLDLARGEPDPAKRQEYAANINRQMAQECYSIPGSHTLWGIPHQPAVRGLEPGTLPDGATTQDSGGFFEVARLWIDPNA